MTIKLGFDIHGVIDTFGAFTTLIEQLLDNDDVEIHVISGLESKYLDEQIGHLVDLSRITNFFSVTDWLVESGAKVEWIDGLPWAGEEEWNTAKAEYCRSVGIDILFDDSPIYAPYFDNIDTIYCQIHNPARKKFKTRDDKLFTNPS